jgi:DNA polymerase-3 subunit delta
MKQDLDSLLAEIEAKKTPSFLLVHGDDFRVRAAVQAVLDLLAPREKRAVSCEVFDGTVADWDEIRAALLTPSLFSSAKTVWVENAPYFSSREQQGSVGLRAIELWGTGKKEEAAGLLIEMLAAEGWQPADWRETSPKRAAAEAADLFGEAGRESGKEIEAIFAFARQHDIEPRTGRGDSVAGLAGFLEQGLPPGVALLMTATVVDRRSRLYKAFAEKGVVLDLALDKDKSGKVSRDVLARFIDDYVRGKGKKIESAARQILIDRAPADLWSLHQELEKLCLYAGSEPLVHRADVEEIVTDSEKSWIFELTRAIAERELFVALGHLRRLLSQGEHPLALLGAMANEVRRLVAAREVIDENLGGKWRKGMSFSEFQREVLGNGPALVMRNPYADYMCFQRAAGVTAREALGYLKAIYATDARLKSSGGNPRLTMERLILDMCRGGDASSSSA